MADKRLNVCKRERPHALNKMEVIFLIELSLKKKKIWHVTDHW